MIYCNFFEILFLLFLLEFNLTNPSGIHCSDLNAMKSKVLDRKVFEHEDPRVHFLPRCPWPHMHYKGTLRVWGVAMSTITRANLMENVLIVIIHLVVQRYECGKCGPLQLFPCES